MEQELRFELDLGRLAYLNEKKNNWADYEQLLRPVFQVFVGHKKINKNIVGSALKSCIKLCLAPLETPNRGTLYL